MKNLDDRPDIYGWIGEDEQGSGQVGLKRALTPVGEVPLAAIANHLDRMTAKYLVAQLRRQADDSGMAIRLVRYVAVEEAMTIEPRGLMELQVMSCCPGAHRYDESCIAGRP